MMQEIKTASYKIYDFNVDRQHPYPGLFPFREQDRDYFFGRKKEIDELSGLIDDNVLTVVFGKSGIGKTSLLRAGLMPNLRNSYFFPIYLRIDFDHKELPPIVQVKETIAAKIKELDSNAVPFGDLTLWEYFSYEKILGGFIKPLLFFDQLEEMFTTGKNNPGHVNAFVTEIADLIENRVPVSLQEKLEKENKTLARTDRDPQFRVIFSLREDYLPQLEMLNKHIPSVRFSRYRVSQMKGKDAVDAVLKPGKEIIKDQEVAVDIIKKIPGAKGADYKPFENIVESWESKKIEPFLLSLFCYQVNEKRLEAKAGEISRELIKDISTEDIIKDYYEDNIGRFPPNVKIAIEDLLLTEEGYRKLQDIDSLKTGYGVTGQEIEKLVDRRIIRKETRIDIDYIELIHDVLTPILKESRDKRQEEEQREQELAARKKKYSRIIVAVVCVAAVFLALLTAYAFQQEAIAEKQSRNNKAYELAARSTNLADKDPTLGFRLAESAYRTEGANPDAYNALLNAFYYGEFCRAILRHDDQVTAAGFSPDEKHIVTVDRNRTARYWDFNGKLIKSAKTGNEAVGPETASPDGKRVEVPADANKIARVLGPDGDLIRELKGHKAEITSFAFSPGGKYMVTASKDNTVRLWDLTPIENKIKLFSQHTSERSDFFAAFSPGGGRILTVNAEKAILWDLSGRPVQGASPAGDDLRLGKRAAFSPGGKYIIFLTDVEEKIGVWDLEGGGTEIVPLPLAVGVYSAAFSPDKGRRTFVTASQDNTARLWDLQGTNVTEIAVFKGHTLDVNSASFSPDGKYIVTAGWDKTARVWDLEGSEKEVFTGHDGSVNAAVFSGDGKHVVTASSDGTARMWDLKGNQLQVFEGHGGAVRSAGFSPDGQYIITGSEDKTTRIWNLNGLRVYVFKGFNDIIHFASFSPDGKYILIAPAKGPAQYQLIDPEEINIISSGGGF
jgi:WD40 repeat protein